MRMKGEREVGVAVGVGSGREIVSSLSTGMNRDIIPAGSSQKIGVLLPDGFCGIRSWRR